MKIPFLLLILFEGYLAQNINSVECPIAGNPDPSTVTEEQCNQYTACEFNTICNMKVNFLAGYIIDSDPVDTGRGFTVNLTKSIRTTTLYGGDISTLSMEVIYHEDYHLQIKIVDPANARYEVPFALSLPVDAGTNPMYTVSLNTVGSPFQFNVTRASTGNVLFRSMGPLTFEDQFIQISTMLQSQDLYGLGEHAHSQLKHSFVPSRTFPIFARDESNNVGNDVNQYGAHPYYINIEDPEGNTHSVLLYNSNAMEYRLFETDGGIPCVTMRTIGGILDFHIFLGPTPEDVNIQYATTVGMATYPPYWAFGFHLSRWGYNSSTEYRDVRNRMKAQGIPQDGQVFDIDYMINNRPFTYDDTNWDMPDLIEELKADNLHVITMLHPAMATDMNYQPYIEGRAQDIFVKWDADDIPTDQEPDADDYVVGWSMTDSKVAFPDFFSGDSTSWWKGEITYLMLNESLDFDGFVIDNNIPTNSGTDLIRPPLNYPDTNEDWSLKCPNNTYDSPPYPTLASVNEFSESQRLSDKTICMSAMHSNTDGSAMYRHYDVHNVYGMCQAAVTFTSLEDLFVKERPTIITKSTFPGVGQFAFHSLGDNSATWEDLRASIVGIIEFNMFAIPMVGADVCGFLGEPTEELCIRWTQAGAFYPFNRNHNTLGAADQDPANPLWSQAPSIARDVLLLRYKFVPLIYALFHRAHMNGGSVIRPMFNVFPTDLTARDINDQFFWGDMLMVAPVMEEGALFRSIYFPEGRFYDITDGYRQSDESATITVSAELDKIPVYVRGGHIIPYQEPTVTLSQSRLNGMGFIVALDENGAAIGEVFWDDGYQEHDMMETYLGVLDFASSTLSLTPNFNATAAEGVMLEEVTFFGIVSEPAAVTVNGGALDAGNINYDIIFEVLVLTISVPINEALSIVIS